MEVCLCLLNKQTNALIMVKGTLLYIGSEDLLYNIVAAIDSTVLFNWNLPRKQNSNVLTHTNIHIYIRTYTYIYVFRFIMMDILTRWAESFHNGYYIKSSRCTLQISSNFICHLCLNKAGGRSAWVAQGVKASAFGSGHDPRVLGSSPASGSLLSREPVSSSLSACLSAYL